MLRIIKGIFSVLTLAVLLSGTSVYAQQQGTATDALLRVPANRTASFTVAFRYGSDLSTQDLTNAVATATIINSKDSSATPPVQFELTGTKDAFNGDPAQTSSTPPAGPSDCNNFATPTNSYEVPSALMEATKLNRYGLQTAKNTAQASGTLPRGHSGCILLQVKVAPNAAVGDAATIQFNWDAGPSPQFLASERPDIQIRPIEIVAAQQAAASSVSSVSSSSSSSSSRQSSSSSSSIVAKETARTGAFEVFALLGIISLVIAGFVMYKSKKDVDYHNS
jgi:hypothetical protein